MLHRSIRTGRTRTAGVDVAMTTARPGQPISRLRSPTRQCDCSWRPRGHPDPRTTSQTQQYHRTGAGRGRTGPCRQGGVKRTPRRPHQQTRPGQTVSDLARAGLAGIAHIDGVTETASGRRGRRGLTEHHPAARELYCTRSAGAPRHPGCLPSSVSTYMVRPTKNHDAPNVSQGRTRYGG